MINLSSPLDHLIVGTIGGVGIYVVSQNVILSAGFFLGSWLIMDLDHVWEYWKAIKFSPLKMINVKEFFRWNEEKSMRFLKKPHLCFLPLHTVEFLLLWLCLVKFLYGISAFSAYFFCISAFAAMIIHLIMDRLELRQKTPYANKYCHSAIEYWWRYSVGEEAAYEDVWPEDK